MAKEFGSLRKRTEKVFGPFAEKGQKNCFFRPYGILKQVKARSQQDDNDKQDSEQVGMTYHSITLKVSTSFLLSPNLATLETNPKQIKVVTIELPPYDKSGNVIPVIGIIPVFIPIFTTI